MICPSCSYETADKIQFCTRCRMPYSKTSLFFSHVRGHLSWVLRRATAGFWTGLIAWIFIPMITRILAQDSSQIFIYTLTGLMGGAFLGCVDGMVEESTPKTIRGALLGGLGGALGGVVFIFLKGVFPESQILWAIFFYWAVAGAFIGIISALWERQPKKLAAGIISGFLGGGVGGYLGAAVHAYLVQNVALQSWLMQRSFEALIGGLIGVTLWFSIGYAERLFIFKRRFVKNQDFKKCDQCKEKNPLRSWYCGNCGSVLQESAPAGKLNLPPYLTLMGLKNTLRFFSRLSGATGFIAGFVAFFIFLPGEPFFLVGALVLIALVSAAFQTLFLSLSETFQILIKK